MFESDRDNNDKDEIYRISVDGANEKLLRSDPNANLTYPNFSADGSKIFYGAVANRNGDLYVMDADGQNPRLMRSHASSPRSLKKTGELAFIAYDVTSDGSKLRELYVSKSDGTALVPITNLNH